MKRLIFVFALLVAASSLVAGSALAAKPDGAGNQLRCFSGGGGTCTLDRAGKTAFLVTGTAPPGYAGVELVSGKSLIGRTLSSIDYSFSYACDVGDPCVGAGSPRLSIPIDSTGDGVTDAYAFLHANTCGTTPSTSGTVSTTDPLCQVYYDTIYSNWDAFVLANPTYTIGNGHGWVVADDDFEGTISNFSAKKS